MSLRRVLCDIPNWAGESSGGNQLSFRPRYVRKFLSEATTKMKARNATDPTIDLMTADIDIETVRTIVVDDMRAAIR